MSRRYDVVPFKSDWHVKIGDITLASFTDKPRAVRDGKALAEANVPATLVIHDENGGVESEETFA